jgi:hypothetical protein
MGAFLHWNESVVITGEAIESATGKTIADKASEQTINIYGEG